MNPTDIISPFAMQHVMSTGRSWWVLAYRDGTIKYEWQEHPGGSKLLLPNSSYSATSEWENTSKKGLALAALIFPDGGAGGFKDPSDDSIFQLKTGFIDLAINGGGDNPAWCRAHILGVIKDSDGNCECIAWEPRTQRPVTFDDNINQFEHYNLGKLSI